ncbi:flavodoxin [Marinobacterium lutimaris]|uniref:Flavodoxin n=1 Tax=Marinobacterium lutimaris TaxID=568106 RepID=A0A1H6DHG9_9GAMM|nr:flavodoxin [Marinobacterium lutimaris]SEG84907.1 flavodoxin II [Marinobacterium lutimaris]
MLAILYGSTTGNTSDVAVKIQQQLGEGDLFDVQEIGLEITEEYDQIIFAIPTWDYGEVQEDWLELWETFEFFDLSGKVCAFVGLGDQYGYAEWFLDAMGMLHDQVVARGASVIGHWPVEGYEFDESKALTPDGKYFVGLALDEDSQRDMTDDRIATWCEQLKREMLQAA